MKKATPSPKTKYERIINIDLQILDNGTSADWQRYDAALPIISLKLLEKNCGIWAGRETCLGKGKCPDFRRTNYWYVLESKAKEASNEIKTIVKNFRLQTITKTVAGPPVDTKKDYKEVIEKMKTLNWAWSVEHEKQTKK